MKQDTKYRLRDSEGKEYIIIDSEKVDMQEELNKTITKQMKEIERLNNKEERLIRRLEDLIIVGEQVENEWAVDICKMIIEELKGREKE